MVTMAMASLLVEKDVLARLKADAATAGLVPAAQIYPRDWGQVPTWPFIQPQQPQGLPLRGSCLNGAQINFGLSAFTRGTASVTARDHCAMIGDAVENLIDRLGVDIAGLGRVRYRLADVLLMKDGAEPGAQHFSCTVRARVISS